MKLFVLLILAVFASEKKENEENSNVVKIEEDEYSKVNKKSKFIGVNHNKDRYHRNESKWRVQRWSKREKKDVYNGYYDDEETAAHASDTLARQLMENGEQNHKLNFPDDYTKVYPEKSSKYIGVSCSKKESKWKVERWNKNEKKLFHNGYYSSEETAAHASDNLARKLMKNGEQKLKLNFPDDHIEVYPEEKSSKYIGVSYHKNLSKWRVQRWSKNENKVVANGYYDDEETAAHASDTLARKIMAKGAQRHKLNFPDDNEVYPENQKNKRKRQNDSSLKHPQNN